MCNHTKQCQYNRYAQAHLPSDTQSFFLAQVFPYGPGHEEDRQVG